MAVKIEAVVGYEMPPGWESSARAAKVFWRLMRKAMYAGAEYWHAKILPKHFTAEALSLYPIYRPRAAGRRGDRRPLVETGQLKRETAGTPPRITQRAARNTATARVKLTTVKQFRQRKIPSRRKATGLGGWQQYRKELVAHNDAELKTIGRIITKEMDDLIEQDKKRRRKPLV